MQVFGLVVVFGLFERFLSQAFRSSGQFSSLFLLWRSKLQITQLNAVTVLRHSTYISTLLSLMTNRSTRMVIA